MKRTVCGKPFKLERLSWLVQVRLPSVSELVEKLGNSSLRRWINEYDEYGESAFPGHGNALFNSTYEIQKVTPGE